MGMFVCEVKKIFYIHVILTRLNLESFKNHALGTLKIKKEEHEAVSQVSMPGKILIL
jgi:hypothetical protein